MRFKNIEKMAYDMTRGLEDERISSPNTNSGIINKYLSYKNKSPIDSSNLNNQLAQDVADKMKMNYLDANEMSIIF